VKAKAPEVLASTIKPQALYKRPIALGTATDPYQPAEKRYRVTRGILEVLARYPGISLSIVTKSPLITRDIDILTAIDAHADLTILVSLITLERGVLEVFDPRAPSASERLKTVEALSRAGLDAGIHCAPILPGLTDGTGTIEELCRAARDHGARFLGAQVLFLTSTIRARFWPLLAARFPDHLPLYRRLYASGLNAREGYRRLVIGRVRELRARYGLEGLSRRAEGREQPEPAWPPAAQLA
jgi:DNA repair photolyase